MVDTAVVVMGDPMEDRDLMEDKDHLEDTDHLDLMVDMVTV